VLAAVGLPTWLPANSLAVLTSDRTVALCRLPVTSILGRSGVVPADYGQAGGFGRLGP